MYKDGHAVLNVSCVKTKSISVNHAVVLSFQEADKGLL